LIIFDTHCVAFYQSWEMEHHGELSPHPPYSPVMFPFSRYSIWGFRASMIHVKVSTKVDYENH
jgi:hypothetical protein